MSTGTSMTPINQDSTNSRNVMKIIQSFWTGKKDARSPFGWYNAKHHYLGWILSVNQMRTFYDEVELFTDREGYRVLIDTLKLPYTKVHVVMDDLNHYTSGLWALPKIKAYSLMEEPFLHVDGDVFVWKPFPKDLLASGLIAQNLEYTSAYYRDMWANIRPKLTYCSPYMKDFDEGSANNAYNMGIFGGHDLRFIRKYANASFEFVDRNTKKHGEINLINFNIFFEQVLFHEMVRSHSKNVEVLIKENIGDNEYRGFGNFDEVPSSRTYLHLLGFFKRQLEVCRKLETYVLKYYPEYYSRLEHYLNLNGIDGQGYTHRDNQRLITAYQESLLRGDTSSMDTSQRILGRNLFMEGQLAKFQTMSKSSQPFYVVATSDFNIHEGKDGATHILIKELGEDFHTMPLLAIDYIIFKELKVNPFTRKSLNASALEFLSDDFPASERQNFLDILWKRISYLISMGILVALPGIPSGKYKEPFEDTLISA